MEQVTVLAQDESIWLDTSSIAALYKKLGQNGAQDLICYSMEEMAVRLSHCEALFHERKAAALSSCVEGVGGLAEQIGMAGLSLVSGHVCHCLEISDETALAATFARMIRIGERSLTAVWEMQDLSV